MGVIPASVSPVARILSCDGNRRTDELKGKSKALQTDIDTKIKEKTNCMLTFYILESDNARTQGLIYNAEEKNRRIKNEVKNRMWCCGNFPEPTGN